MEDSVEKKKRGLLHVGICVGLVCLIWGGYFFATEKMSQRIERVLEDDFSWVVQVDEVRMEENEFVIEGFAFELNEEAKGGTFDIVLHNLDSDEYFFPKMKYMKRKDVNDYFLCEYDYTESGFIARINEMQIDLQDNNYEVLLRPKGGRKPYQFSTYLVEGELMSVNPKEYVPLDVEGTDLEEVVENGTLRVYEPENYMYVYQYEGELYWIADEEYAFVDEDTGVQYQINTTQVEKLPMQRLENGWSWDNMGFMFSNYEIDNARTGKYRVAKMSLPTEYSITKIWTGNYIDGWIWRKDFRPRYDLDLYGEQ